MQTPINQDIDLYRSDFFKGLSMRETGWGVIAFISGIGIMLFLTLYLKIPTQISTLLGMPIILVIGINGFYKKNNMTFYEMIKKKISIKRQKPLVLKEDDIRRYKVSLLEREVMENTKKKRNKNGTKIKTV